MPATKKGWQLEEIDELRADIDQLFRDRFGDGIDLDDDQTPGLIAGVMSEWSSLEEKLVDGIANSYLVLKATDTHLDDIGADEGIYRHQASYASVQLQVDVYVDPTSPVLITEGSQFSTADGQIFNTDADVTVTDATTITGTDGTVTPLEDDDGNALGRVMISADADSPGTDSNVMPGSIINAEEAIDGFYAVTNPNGAIGGGDMETDNELRLRILENRQHPVNGTVSGTETAVRNVDGVKDVQVINNTEMVADKYGNPPKSAHLYVIGGDDQAVADAFFDVVPLLTQTEGKISKTVTDVSGKTATINFDRATTVPVYIDLALSIDSMNFDETAGPANIKTNILSYFDTLNMGDQVLYSKLFGPVFSVSGVNDVDITLGTDKTKLAGSDVVVDQFNLATTSADNITVTIK